ncbi:MAG: hypothetical protein BWY83_02510 [bacterium ADurb.Bin478]|nr:MAG: hypothetical protein BWY83_02510 [bacterium ADurb.Bin478]
MIPFAESLRRADRDGVSVMDHLDAELARCFAEILTKATASR